MATTSNQPAISILMNKLEDVRGTTLPPALQNYISDAETEYEVMCKRLGGDVKQIKAIEEMVFALKNNQILSAKSHAHGAQRAMLLYQKTLQRKVDEKGLMDNLRSGGQAPQAAQIEPKPDYNNYDTGGRREQISGKQNFSTDEHYRDTSRVVDKEYRNTQFPGHRQDQIDSNRSLQKREEAAGDERMKRRLDRMNQISDSMEASVRLRKDNPNLADLSDVLRPTKLAEKYTELYDNDWTDAFEELHNMCRLSERRTIQCLLQILMETYERSCRKAKQQIADVEDEVRRLMTTFKVNTDHGVSETKDMFRGDIGALRQYRKSLAKLSVPGLQQTFGSYLNKIFTQFGCHGKLPQVVEYTNKCVEITWLMSVQDPPVILDNMEDHHGFQTEMYKAFTKHGRNVDFYVWPALLLHKGGPLLAKGVAQGN